MAQNSYEAIKWQTIKNYEIIFCDNNSEDNSLKILKI